MVMCEGMSDPADFTGYQVALWREIATDLGLQETKDWVFSCVDWNMMLEDLANANGSCSFGAAGVEVISANIDLGFKFSWPIYKSGYHILVAAADDGGVWSFTQAFHWSVWLLLGVTAIGVSLLITAVECMTHGNKVNKRGLRGWSWYTTAKLVQNTVQVGDPHTWASKVLVLGYAALTVVMVHLFTASTAGIMTAKNLANDIKGVDDLAGKTVQTWEGYMTSLRDTSYDAVGLPWDTNADTAAFVDNLRSHRYQALVLDTATIMDMASHAEHCDLFPVGGAFQTFDLSIAFPPDAPDGLISNVSTSMVRLQTEGAVLDELERVFMHGETVGKMADIYGKGLDNAHTCADALSDDAAGGQRVDTVIHFKQ
ncbi:hypothetical protein OEZ85_009732 [Tetradesmus obliquus]|uniref:Ionotropic glutamate receptor C-terminal domain-containing protein n=1 Tax=Tetradesmus obliquus TaxID=3088 RepID=A0ABY8U9W2_TETOB|nr:hypothetical protein OEZ85_009732 [Tetradesmus obliquus]